MAFNVEEFRAEFAERQRQAEITRKAEIDHKRWVRRFVAGSLAAFASGAGLLALVLHLVGEL